MIRFDTVDQLAEAYANKYNQGCRHSDEYFTPADVKAYVIEKVVRPAALHLWGIDSHIETVRGFGYVAAA